ncbi:male sterility protein-domain-containing protein [Schizophyllum commune]
MPRCLKGARHGISHVVRLAGIAFFVLRGTLALDMPPRPPSTLATEAIIAMAAKYSEGLPGYVDASTLPRQIDPSTSASPLNSSVAVLLTGSTGHLGSDILEILLKDARVERIFTFDREGKGAAPRARQRARWADKGLDEQLLESPKLVVLCGDLSAPKFGLDKEVYDEMRTKVTIIIHAAWSVNRIRPLAAFEPSVRGLRALVDFARSASQDVRILFTSTFYSARSWPGTALMTPEDSATAASAPPDSDCASPDSDCASPTSTVLVPEALSRTSTPGILGRAPVPESLINNPGVCIGGGGYAQSKYVAERVLAASGLQFASVRIGQLSGSAASATWKGRAASASTQKRAASALTQSRGASATTQRRAAWATSSWLPILFETSVTLGALPDGAEQMVPWLPIDTAARALVDIALSACPLSPSYNMVHPRPISWSQMMRYFQRSLAHVPGKELPLVSFEEWIARLETVACSMTVNAQRGAPGIALLPAFRDISGAFSQTFAMDKALAVSPTLREAAPMSQADVDGWSRLSQTSSHSA